MVSSTLLSRSKCLLSNFVYNFKAESAFIRTFAKKPDVGCTRPDSDCRRAIVDIPPDVDPVCPKICKRQSKKEGILHRIKMKVVEGGTNFGTPFRRLTCKDESKAVKVAKAEDEEETKALPEPEKKALPMPLPRAGVQVSVLGADTAIGQYVALLLKQCPCIKKLRLYEAKDTSCSYCTRSLYQVTEDLQNINTNCVVQAYSCTCCELERCLQNTDIVLMLESGHINGEMSFENRFCSQAPIVKHYTDCIATECPKAFIIVCASPIDCMVPLVAETLKETGWYDPSKVLGSLAVPEMRASTLAARALCLEPWYTRVPCVGGTEGDTLVPLFSKAVEFFDFARHNALLMTDAVRTAPSAVTRAVGPCLRAADLSEAHALAKLVIKVAQAQLCQDIPRVSGFVETDAGQVISPARFLAIDMLLNQNGISEKFDFPPMMSLIETELLDVALFEIEKNVNLAKRWYAECMGNEYRNGHMQFALNFHTNLHYDKLSDCAFQLT